VAGLERGLRAFSDKRMPCSEFCEPVRVAAAASRAYWMPTSQHTLLGRRWDPWSSSAIAGHLPLALGDSGATTSLRKPGGASSALHAARTGAVGVPRRHAARRGSFEWFLLSRPT